MVFGVFDRLHPGHLYFLSRAEAKGKVIAVVARDRSVRRIKNKSPQDKERRRLMRVRGTGLVFRAVLGDMEEGSYEVVRRFMPERIVLGYDQKALRRDLERKMRKKELPRIRLFILEAYEPAKFHTSLLPAGVP